jgi:hypothetical protein
MAMKELAKNQRVQNSAKNKGLVIIYGGGGGWHRREKVWVNKILSE